MPVAPKYAQEIDKYFAALLYLKLLSVSLALMAADAFGLQTALATQHEIALISVSNVV